MTLSALPLQALKDLARLQMTEQTIGSSCYGMPEMMEPVQLLRYFRSIEKGDLPIIHKLLGDMFKADKAELFNLEEVECILGAYGSTFDEAIAELEADEIAADIYAPEHVRKSRSL